MAEGRSASPSIVFPGGEALAGGGQAANLGLGAVGDHQQLVEREEAGDLGLVGLELLPGGVDGGFGVGGVLELDDGEGEAVDEEEDVRAALGLALDCELVDGEPVVVGGVVEVDKADELAARLAVAHDLDGDALDEERVEGAVGVDEGGGIGLGRLAERLLAGFRGGGGVEAGDGGLEAAGKDDVAVVGALGGGFAGGDVGAVEDLPADLGEPFEGGFFDDGFGEAGGHQMASWATRRSPSGTRISPERRRGRRASRRVARVRA